MKDGSVGDGVASERGAEDCVCGSVGWIGDDDGDDDCGGEGGRWDVSGW